MLKASRHFEGVFLRILAELTSAERSDFCYLYCRKRPPTPPIPPNEEEMLLLFHELKDENMISSSNVSFLIEFTDTILRYDLTNILLEYKSEVEVGTILEEYVDFRDENPLNVDSLEMSPTQIVSKHLSRKFRDCSEPLTKIVRLSKDTSFQDDLRLSIDEMTREGNELCWSSILQILGFSSELAYRRMCLFPGPSKFHRLLSDIDDVRLVLQEFKILSWMAQNGGAAGCVKFIKKQDPAEMARQKETRILISQIAEQYTTL
ncbi:uncharacterized protein LOC110254899 isoform X2 [Exaiptasia diaphana]|uniref:DED domain-containing protein n=1 Tax=Exaiptasia diaphana TaxID=2652724 RepID=A0A913YCF8_EXADI|nr:uncharacterized protein LOC110254899 isoform X2 [Exaiptasia diaphana]